MPQPKILNVGSMIDVADGGTVVVDIDRTGDTVWVNVDGQCRFRAIRVDELIVRDMIPLSKRKFRLNGKEAMGFHEAHCEWNLSDAEVDLLVYLPRGQVLRRDEPDADETITRIE